jgi:hypothetical protein
MSMRSGLVLFCLFVIAVAAFGQSGTITGTVTDPAGAVVPSAPVEAKNSETGVVYPAVTTDTGNYTVTQLPVGTYQVSVRVQGFKTYIHTNLTLQAAAIIKEDVVLQVDASSDSVTISAEASLLSTENADMTHNVTVQQLDNLPIPVSARRAPEPPGYAILSV